MVKGIKGKLLRSKDKKKEFKDSAEDNLNIFQATGINLILFTVILLILIFKKTTKPKEKLYMTTCAKIIISDHNSTLINKILHLTD